MRKRTLEQIVKKLGWMARWGGTEKLDAHDMSIICSQLADQLREHLPTPRPAVATHVEVTRAMIVAANHAHADYEVTHFKRKRSAIESHEHNKAAMKVALEAALAAAHPHTGYSAVPEVAKSNAAKPAPKLIGWRMADYTAETNDPEKAKNWSSNVTVLPIFEGDPNTKLTASTAPEVKS